MDSTPRCEGWSEAGVKMSADCCGWFGHRRGLPSTGQPRKRVNSAINLAQAGIADSHRVVVPQIWAQLP